LITDVSIEIIKANILYLANRVPMGLTIDDLVCILNLATKSIITEAVTQLLDSENLIVIGSYTQGLRQVDSYYGSNNPRLI